MGQDLEGRIAFSSGRWSPVASECTVAGQFAYMHPSCLMEGPPSLPHREQYRGPSVLGGTHF